MNQQTYFSRLFRHACIALSLSSSPCAFSLILSPSPLACKQEQTCTSIHIQGEKGMHPCIHYTRMQARERVQRKGGNDSFHPRIAILSRVLLQQQQQREPRRAKQTRQRLLTSSSGCTCTPSPSLSLALSSRIKRREKAEADAESVESSRG